MAKIKRSINQTNQPNVLLGGEAVTTPTFQLDGAGSTPGWRHIKTQK